MRITPGEDTKIIASGEPYSFKSLSSSEKEHNIAMRFLFFLTSAITIFIVFMLYYQYIYPIIPQELGGVKPKTAILYSDKNLFLKPKALIIKKDSLYTDTATVYYYNSNIILYKSRSKSANIFEINRAALTNIKWLE